MLIDSCYECHSKEAGQSKGGLSLDSRVGLRQGGNTGPAVVSGNLEESWLWLAVSHAEPDYEMPPKSKLPNDVIVDFRTWIEMGAPDPREGEKEVTTEIDIEEGKKFWSFQPPVRQTPPIVDEPAWSRTDVDRFVFERLQKEGLQPSKPGDARSILRRLSFDLIGMPPTVEFAEHFHRTWEENPVKAIESTIDRLLESQQFGERWGKHWLDLARYAESNGKGANQTYTNAWRYRDYVIDSVNEDKPIDRFIMEQIAGDLLSIKSDEDWQENLIATGFLALGPKNLRETNRRQFIMDMVDEQIDATSTAFLGLTVSCARCHDHKTDPIPTQDYYALAGVFLSSNTHYGTDGIGGRFNQGNLIQLPLAEESGETYSGEDIAAMEEELAEVRLALRSHAAKKREMMQAEPGTQDTQQRSSAKRIRARQSQLEEKLGSITGAGSVKAYAMGMTEKEDVADTAILVRGEVDSPAQVVSRGFLQVLDRSAPAIAKGSSGRLEMARWIASNRNPLTARIYVNRVWEKLFGRGLVASVDNFGTTGQAPSHPELLDHLAIQFMEEGWSLKKLVRSLVLTRTYLAGSDFDSGNYAKDPDNKFLWRAAPRRLDAEAFRDSILATTNQLLFDRPFRSPVAEHSMVELGRKGSPNVHYNFPPYRSVYLPPVRDAMPEMIKTFDGADPELVTGSRDTSNGPEQSLFLMNSPFILEQSGHFAELLIEHSRQPSDQIHHAFQRAFGRAPTRGEYNAALQFHREFVNNSRGAEREFLKLFCQGLLCSAEFRYLQ
ncbi:MAG: PSD1 and planctomycete cytochrome C domain-containing protein [Verrucomicrobiota bacterium]